MEKDLILFFTLCMIAIVADVVITIVTWERRKTNYKLLTALFATTALMTGFYLSSVLTDNYTMNSWMSSLYFIGIDLVLFFAYRYIHIMANELQPHKPSLIGYCFFVWGILDIATMLINPVWEIAISYRYYVGEGAPWIYEAKLLYNTHLALTYSMVVMCLCILIYNTQRASRIYRRRFRSMTIGILVVVACNGAFLFMPSLHFYDFSLLFYSFICGLILWNNNFFPEHGIVNEASRLVLRDMPNPVLMFDFSGRAIMHNEAAEPFIENIGAENARNMFAFMAAYELDDNIGDVNETQSFQTNIEIDGRDNLYRCDFNVFRDKHGKPFCRMIMLSDYSLEYDLLTGFKAEVVFRQNISGLENSATYPVGVAVVDINHLAEINRTQGKEFGDYAIKSLAGIIRKNTPAKSVYVRLNDANLLFLCSGTTLAEMRQYMNAIYEDMKTVERNDGKEIELQNAISMATESQPSLAIAIASATKSMKAKKLMDATSSHSSLLDSLAQTQQESDSCTKEHVKRTQIMGEKLGIRLGLSDVELSNLALLCLLHDIGKLGIPLEILNKPGKLNEDEWTIMRSHAEKGYRIAKASKELEEIADLILHHHECWNGKGYPDRLEREAIPMLSRIIAVVDTFDAMTNDRPYRQAMSVGQACKELMRCAGTQFDPYIVSEFIEFLRENEMYSEVEEAANSNEEREKLVKPMGLEEGGKQEERDIHEIIYTKYTLNSNGTIVVTDDNFETMTGYSKEELAEYNLTHWDLIFSEDLAEYRKLVQKKLQKDHEAYIEHRIRRKDGSGKYVFCYGREFFDSVTREARTQITVTDISNSAAMRVVVDREKESARRSLKRWEDSIRRDPLTGTLNRIAFQNDVQMKLMDEQSRVVMLMMDLDYFKKYNDTYGHKYGDEMLVCLATSLRNNVEEIGIASRMGGDEFSAMLCLHREATEQDIEQIVSGVWAAVTKDLKDFAGNEVSISLGAAIATDDIKAFNALYKKADFALYQVKENGRGNYAIA